MRSAAKSVLVTSCYLLRINCCLKYYFCWRQLDVFQLYLFGDQTLRRFSRPYGESRKAADLGLERGKKTWARVPKMSTIFQNRSCRRNVWGLQPLLNFNLYISMGKPEFPFLVLYSPHKYIVDKFGNDDPSNPLNLVQSPVFGRRRAMTKHFNSAVITRAHYPGIAQI